MVDPHTQTPEAGRLERLLHSRPARGVATALLVTGLVNPVGSDTVVASPDSAVEADGGSTKTPADSSICREPVSDAGPGDTVNLMVTSVQADGFGYSAARSSDETPVYNRPASQQFSTGVFGPGTRDPNPAFVEVGSDGKYCIDVGDAAAHTIIDEFGYTPEGNYVPISPVRVLNTRGSTKTPADSSICREPVSDAGPGDTVNLMVTSVQADGFGYSAARSSDETPVYNRPASQQFSTGVFGPGTRDPNPAFVEVGSDGKYCIDVGDAAAHTIIDEFGYTPEGNYVPISPVRVLNTRGSTKTPADSSICREPVSDAGPGDTVNLMVTSVQADGFGYSAARSSDETPVYNRPASQQFSTGVFGPGTRDPNPAFVEVGSDGKYCIDVGDAAAHTIIDEFGYTPEGNYVPISPVRVEDSRSGFSLTPIRSTKELIETEGDSAVRVPDIEFACQDYFSSDEGAYFRVISTDLSNQDPGSVASIRFPLNSFNDGTADLDPVTYMTTDENGAAAGFSFVDYIEPDSWSTYPDRFTTLAEVLRWEDNDQSSYTAENASITRLQVENLECELQPIGESPIPASSDDFILTAQVGKNPIGLDDLVESSCDGNLGTLVVSGQVPSLDPYGFDDEGVATRIGFNHSRVAGKQRYIGGIDAEPFPVNGEGKRETSLSDSLFTSTNFFNPLGNYVVITHVDPTDGSVSITAGFPNFQNC